MDLYDFAAVCAESGFDFDDFSVALMILVEILLIWLRFKSFWL